MIPGSISLVQSRQRAAAVDRKATTNASYQAVVPSVPKAEHKRQPHTTDPGEWGERVFKFQFTSRRLRYRNLGPGPYQPGRPAGGVDLNFQPASLSGSGTTRLRVARYLLVSERGDRANNSNSAAAAGTDFPRPRVVGRISSFQHGAAFGKPCRTA
ncbi:uncharacterized protein CLUP02_17550 [Colletotrichum lupini]|uniref:Uncharacterized protein n=1 Tax=Colletotrichum lupini TaxID=145971 RepID=A0A9Q8SER3_9PEZI|nr:uncharacterized protein CLUP02_17550 [Colletotrichum lupini]UQC76039.1 hypothetical protein CLUP02_17550 [Colletotrichum lupini]